MYYVLISSNKMFDAYWHTPFDNSRSIDRVRHAIRRRVIQFERTNLRISRRCPPLGPLEATQWLVGERAKMKSTQFPVRSGLFIASPFQKRAPILARLSRQRRNELGSRSTRNWHLITRWLETARKRYFGCSQQTPVTRASDARSVARLSGAKFKHVPIKPHLCKQRASTDNVPKEINK